MKNFKIQAQASNPKTVDGIRKPKIFGRCEEILAWLSVKKSRSMLNASAAKIFEQ